MTVSGPATGVRAAILLASFNRAQQTLACLRAIEAQEWPEGWTRTVFLVDDGSTDGTPEQVAREFPLVVLIPGTGHLYWCNSMRLAWDRAAREDFDVYVWLNDDTRLLPGAVRGLLETWMRATAAGSPETIVVGSCRDPGTGRHSYGGLLRPGRHPARLLPLAPADHPLPCDTLNGNLVLVPRSVFRKVGNMRPFAHAIGDVDYGLIAREAGCRVVVAPGYLGECAHNPLGEKFERLPFRARLRTVFGPKLFPPVSWMRYYWRHAGWRALVYWHASLMGLLFPSLRNRR